MHALTLVSVVIIQTGFLTAVAFLACYTAWHRWWRSVHGRSLGLLSIAVITVLGRSTLIDWHVLQPDRIQSPIVNPPTLGDWISTWALALLPLTFLIMLYQLAVSRYQKKRPPLSGLGCYQVPASWLVYRPTSRVGWALSPQGEWFLVDGLSVVSNRRPPDNEAILNRWLRDGVLTADQAPLPEGPSGGITDSA
jgi:hypothetical protein